MNITSEQLRQIIQEELNIVLKEKQQLEEISLKQFIVGLLIAKAGMGASTAAAEVDTWNISNEIVDVMQQGHINNQDINKAVATSKSTQKTPEGEIIKSSMKEITSEQCEGSLEEVSMMTKKVSGKELEVNIQCNNGLEYLFVYSHAKDSTAMKYTTKATLKVKAPKNKSIEGNFSGEEALQKAGSALDYAKKMNPGLKKGLESFERANVK